jgi:hypothetical protein
LNASAVALALQLPRAWDTASAALTACASALGDGRPVAQVAGASGLAFRVASDETVSLAALHAYPFGEVLGAAAARLGYAAQVVSSSERPGSALHAAAQARALALISHGLAAGRPTLVWGVHAPEFGLVRGRDGEWLQVSGILDGFVTGRAAWRAIASALERGVLDPSGLAYAAQRLAEARAAAAAWLDEAERALALPLDGARAAYRRAASMLGELAACHPFPPPPSTMLTNTDRDEALALVSEAARAEGKGLEAIAEALARLDRRRADALTLVELDAARVGDLFACIGELPVAGLEREAEVCRARAAALRAQLLYDGARLVGHLLYAPLEAAHHPVAADGRRWFLYCPWLARELRGRGLGARLFAALEAAARSAGVDGILTFATTDERFLHEGGLAHHGFVEVARRGELRLMERTLTDVPSRARFVELPAPPPRRGALPVLVRHSYNCPLLLRTRRDLAAAAGTAGGRLALDEADAGPDPAGATVGGRPVPHAYLPPAALAAALQDVP